MHTGHWYFFNLAELLVNLLTHCCSQETAGVLCELQAPELASED